MSEDESWRESLHRDLGAGRKSKRSSATKRGSWGERGYDRRWLAAAAVFKDEHPWCVGCTAIGLRVPAEVVDHIVPHEGDQIRFWCGDNWQSSCKWHHDSIKPALERQWRAGKIPDTALRLDSPQAIGLTRARYRYPVGIDGFAIR